jgi:hypothetical protein
MVVKRKPEGVERLIKVDDIDLSQMTLTDFFVAFSLLNTIQSDNPEQDARRAYDRAEALVRERFLRE